MEVSGKQVTARLSFEKDLQCGGSPFQAPDNSGGDRSVTRQGSIVDLCQDGLEHPTHLPDLLPCQHGSSHCKLRALSW